MRFFPVVKKKVVSGTRAASGKARRKGVMERASPIISSEHTMYMEGRDEDKAETRQQRREGSKVSGNRFGT